MRERQPTTRSELRPREGVWSSRPLPVRRTARPVPGWWQPFVFLPMFYGTIAQPLNLAYPSWLLFSVFVGLVALAVMTLVWRISEAFALRGVPRDREFSDAPPGVNEYPTEIVLYDAGVYVGADRGFAWFDEGRLIFNGGACSFALAAGDFYKRRVIGGRNFYSGVPGDALRFGTYGRTAYVRFCPLVGAKGLGFNYALGRFLSRDETTSAPRQWPPLTPYAEVPSQLPSDSRVDALQ